MSAANPAISGASAALISAALARQSGQLLVGGLCGAQGSGKSTLAAALKDHFGGLGVPAAILSLDDLYLTRTDREELGRRVHPLLRTRGVPGTHDIGLGLELISAFDRGEPVALPRFDKARDDRRPETEWVRASANTQLLIVEGWCVGALPQAEAALDEPINDLEWMEDGDRRWRRFVNAALAGNYQQFFARIDVLILLAAPDFATVRRWRTEQEHDLRATSGHAPGIMSDAEIVRFVAHYERLTKHILTEMRGRADLVVDLAADRSAPGLSRR